MDDDRTKRKRDYIPDARTPLKKDSTPDRRYARKRLKKDGTPDRRCAPTTLKKDGTPDRRFKSPSISPSIQARAAAFSSALQEEKEDNEEEKAPSLPATVTPMERMRLLNDAVVAYGEMRAFMRQCLWELVFPGDEYQEMVDDTQSRGILGLNPVERAKLLSEFSEAYDLHVRKLDHLPKDELVAHTKKSLMDYFFTDLFFQPNN